MDSTKVVLAAVVTTLSAVGSFVVGVGAATLPADVADRHCVIEVTGVENDVFVTRPEVCFSSESEAIGYAETLGDQSEGVARSSGGTTIGTHYSSTGFSGSSVSAGSLVAATVVQLENLSPLDFGQIFPKGGSSH